MKRFSMLFSVVSFLFITIAILATWLYQYSQVDYKTYHQNTELVRAFQENTAELIREIILVQQGQFQHYDAITTVINSNEFLITRLVLNQSDEIVELINAWNELKQNVESIKSDYAVYQNSLRYFPKGTQYLLLELAAQKNKEGLVESLLSLERRVMQFSLGHGQQSFKKLERQTQSFALFAKRMPKELAFAIKMLSKHGQILLSRHQLLQQYNGQLLNTKIPQQTQLLLDQYNNKFQKQVNQAAEIRSIFYIVCLILVLIVAVVILKLKRILSELYESEVLLRHVADNAPVMLWMTNQDGCLVFINERWQQASNSSEGEPIVSVFIENICPDDKERVRLILLQQKNKKAESVFQFRIMGDEEEYLYWSAYLIARYSKDGEYLGLICSTVDITQQKKLELETQLAARVFEHSLEGILISDADNKIVQTNQAFSILTGYSQAEVLNKNPRLLSSGVQGETFYKGMWKAIEDVGLWQGEVHNRRKNGEVFHEWLTIIAIKNEGQDITHHIAIFSDITEKKRAEKDINFLAHYDPLTRLPNRVLFNERMEHAIQQAVRNKHSVAVMFLDLDRFKAVNDSLGHAAGDKLLIKVAEDITHCIREVDTLARVGGDEFIILLEAMDPQGVYKDCPIVADKIIQKLSSEYILSGSQAFIGVSIGISIFPHDGETIENLTQRADMAMYHAKDKGRNNFQFYSDQLNKVVQTRLRMEADLRIAIDQQQFFLQYQPQYNLATQEIDGFEALIRWQHPEMGLIAPDDFIAIAEETGLIVEIGQWVLDAACSQLVEWNKSTGLALRMAINVSLKQLEKEGFVECVKAVLERTGIPAELVELEVTESIFLEEGSVTLQILIQLHQLGVQISMDDFGTGYSNMSYLKKLPIDRIKIDRCFIMDIPYDESDAAIVCAIIDIARHFEIKVIAEGIEYQEQADYLLSKGCDEGQGYLFSKPLSSDMAGKLLLD